jgi:hypothetical protein
MRLVARGLIPPSLQAYAAASQRPDVTAALEAAGVAPPTSRGNPEAIASPSGAGGDSKWEQGGGGALIPNLDGRIARAAVWREDQLRRPRGRLVSPAFVNLELFRTAALRSEYALFNKTDYSKVQKALPQAKGAAGAAKDVML